MSNLSKTRFLLPAIFLLLLANFGVSVFLLLNKKPVDTIKYVDSARIYTPLAKDILKTLEQMNQTRIKELQVLGEQIDRLEDKKKIKGYLSTPEQKELDDKQTKRNTLLEKLQKEHNQQFQKMLLSKVKGVNEILDRIAIKHNCTIQPTSENRPFKIAIAEKANITDLVLEELGMVKETKKGKT